MHYIREGVLYTTVLVDETLSLRDAILQALTKLNLEQHLALPEDESLYEIFGARKSGKKKDGLPAFEKSISLAQTCLKNFSLIPLFESPKLQSKDSIKSIETEICLESRTKNEIA